MARPSRNVLEYLIEVGLFTKIPRFASRKEI